MEQTNIEKLIGESTFFPNERDDDQMEAMQEEAYNKYLFREILDHMGTFDIKVNFVTVINEIRSLPIQKQKMFCKDLLEKVKELYDFEIYIKALTEEMDPHKVYEFVKFLEFDNIKFLSRLWEFLRVDLREINVPIYCQENKEKIAKETDDLLTWVSYNEYIDIFLRTYHMNDLANWVAETTEPNKMLITLNIEERKMK